MRKQSFHSCTLCFPGTGKSCFACCPPIRPAGYEHRQYRNSLERFFRENTLNFDPGERKVQPITGFSCWAMGYLDKDCRLLGCLLHPAVNQGEDLRYRIDYGGKCSREVCQESRVFSELDESEQSFWLKLTEGLDSFAYSSRTENPLFDLLNWGARTLKIIAAQESERNFNRTSFFTAYPFFLASGNPKPRGYLLNSLINGENIHLLRQAGFKACFEMFYGDLKNRLDRELPKEEMGEPIYRFDMDRYFLDFLRLSLKRVKMEFSLAAKLKEISDEALQRFKKEVHQKWV